MDGQCGKCGLKKRICQIPGGDSPAGCCTKLYESALRKADDQYSAEAERAFALAASRQEKAGYVNAPVGDVLMPAKPRILEIIEFCARMGYRRVGFAFCGGLHREAATAAGILTEHCLEVVSAMCKVGGVDKTRLGLDDNDKLLPGLHESMCNPIGQAYIMNEAKTDFNIVLGLCVGHDSLFLKHSEAMCTILAVKDRLLCHNPLAAIYTHHSYYKYI